MTIYRRTGTKHVDHRAVHAPLTGAVHHHRPDMHTMAERWAGQLANR